MSERQPTPQPERCTDAIGQALLGYDGVRLADLDMNAGRLTLRYEPAVLPPEELQRLVERLGAVANERVQRCALRGQEGACEACALALQRDLAAAGLPHAQARFSHGVLTAAAGPGGAATAELSIPLRPARPSVPPARPGVTLPPLERRQMEPVLVALTAIFGLAAALLGSYLSPLAITLLWLAAYVAGGAYGLLDGIAKLRERALDVNLLMIAAALGAAALGQPAEGAALLFLFSLSNALQALAMERSRNAIRALMDLRPAQALVRRRSRLVALPVEQLVLGDRVIVRPGERLPADGVVVEGASAVDQSPLTGESVPVAKRPGDHVFAGTVNGEGSLEIRVTRLAADSTLARIIRLVEEAQDQKARLQRWLDTFEQRYALVVIGAALLAGTVPLLFGQPLGPTLYRAMTLLVVASPCALVISTPASILSAIANAARRGILFKGGVHLERLAGVKVVAFDKTGTLTQGRPELTDVVPLDSHITPERVLQLAAAVEAKSEHPIAGALVSAARERGLELAESRGFRAAPGLGVQAEVDGEVIRVGGPRFFAENGQRVPDGLLAARRRLESQGKTVMLVQGEASGWLGLIAVADAVRPEAPQAVAELRRAGLRVVMLTGDNRRTAAAIAAQTGVDEFHAQLLPQDKVGIVRKLAEGHGGVAMVGDGINDAPALAAATVGVAMGVAGADVALEAADVALMRDDLGALAHALNLARAARRVVWQNIAFSLLVIAGLVMATFAASLRLPLGVVGHEGSTLLVVANGLRLLMFSAERSKGESLKGQLRQVLASFRRRRKAITPATGKA